MAVQRLENGKPELTSFCIIPRTAGSIQALEMPLTEEVIKKVCGLLGLDADTTEKFKTHWQTCANDGIDGYILGVGELIDVAIECEFAAVVERSNPKAEWTFDYTMNRKDVGRAAVRQYQHKVTEPVEAVVDMDAFQGIVNKLVEAVTQLNRDDLWQVAERKLRDLFDELGLDY